MEHKTLNSTSTKIRRLNKPMLILFFINLIFTILLVSFVMSLHIVPMKFIFILWLFLTIFDLGVLLLLKNSQIVFKVVGYVISFSLIIVSSIGMHYIVKTNAFLNNAFGHKVESYTNTYYIVTLENSEYKSIEDLHSLKIGYYDNSPNIDLALKEFNSKINCELEKISDLYSGFSLLNKKAIPAILIEQNLYNFVMDYDDKFDIGEYKIISSFDITIKEENEEIDSSSNAVNIYIGGTDFTETNHDFNMIVTINTKTHKVLLTSIPRDYYVPINGKNGKKDILGYAGVWGINTSRKTLEDFFGINMDYYVKINTESLVGLVDTLGGIEFCSEKEFVTNHAMVMGTYNDYSGKKLYVSKGCKNYTGIQILTIARERKAYADGDRQRQKNCQQIMINIFNKMIRPENLVNYTNVLDAVSDLYITNIPREEVTKIANMTLNGARWTIEQQSVDGYNSQGYVHLSNLLDYVMEPDMDSVANATAKIKQIESGKK